MYSMTGTIRAEQLEKFREYLLERENAEATIQKYLTDIRTFIKYLGGVQTLDKKSILEYKGWLIERYAVNSVNSMLAALNQFLGFLGLDTLKVKRVRIQKSLFLDEEKELTKKEYQRLLRTAKSEGRHQLALCMETIAGTGVRVSELPYFTVESLKKERKAEKPEQYMERDENSGGKGRGKQQDISAQSAALFCAALL